MNAISRTLIFAGAAVASAIIAYTASSLSRPPSVSGFADVGGEFFPDFKDVDAAGALEVVDYSDEQSSEVRFEVKEDDGIWTIPSHHNYPAEAADRLGKTATSLIGIRRTAVASRSKDDWKRYGVEAPDSEGLFTEEERGTRLTLSDGTDNALVDLIIGNKVPDEQNLYYVREPDRDTTYISELEIDLSAKFKDWIDPDLLQVDPSDLVAITLNQYSIDERTYTIEPGEVLDFQREEGEGGTSSWTLEGLGEEEELDESSVSAIATSLDELQIVDVRPKPDGLADDLRINPAIRELLADDMRRQGYFLTPVEGSDELQTVSNEGELVAGTGAGVQYTLYFGEIAKESNQDIEIGEDSAEDEDSDGENDESSEGLRRYLLVKVGFNQELLGPKPTEPEEPVTPEILKDKVKESDKEEAADESETADVTEEAAKQEEDEEEATAVGEQATDDQENKASQEASEDKKESDKPKSGDESQAAEEGQPSQQKADSSESTETQPTEKVSEGQDEDEKPDPKAEAQQQYDRAMINYRAAKRGYATEVEEWENRAKAGREKVEELSQRFSGWYYVISSESFDKFRLSRGDVVSEKSEEGDETKSPGPGPGGLPGGLPFGGQP